MYILRNNRVARSLRSGVCRSKSGRKRIRRYCRNALAIPGTTSGIRTVFFLLLPRQASLKAAECTTLPFVILAETFPTSTRLAGRASVEILIYAKPFMGAFFLLFLLATEFAEEFANARLRHLNIPRASKRARFGEFLFKHGIIGVIDIDIVGIDIFKKLVSDRFRPDGSNSGERPRHTHAVVLGLAFRRSLPPISRRLIFDGGERG